MLARALRLAPLAVLLGLPALTVGCAVAPQTLNAVAPVSLGIAEFPALKAEVRPEKFHMVSAAETCVLNSPVPRISLV